jgi:hypothetical protein
MHATTILSISIRYARMGCSTTFILLPLINASMNVLPFVEIN